MATSTRCSRRSWRGAPSAPLLSLVLVGIFLLGCSVPRALCYVRPPARANIAVSLAVTDINTPQQVHISMVGADKMRVSWITVANVSSTVYYGTSPAFLTYTSGRINNVVIGPLLPSTIYYYRCSNATKEFSLKTPPAQLPSRDLGQTGWTKTTLDHVAVSGYDVLLLPGDLSYADNVQSMWDSFGLLVEPLASQRPWMVTEGNHEIEKVSTIESFRAYNARWRMPYELSGSSSNLYYSFDAAGGAVHVIMLGSYTDFAVGTAQYNWLIGDLAKINRQTTPWVVALIHAPWYNTNYAHQNEGEPMRLAMEGLLYKARVDVVFAGHVHAYERFDRVNLKKQDKCGPVHITVGDGGNREGLASAYISPKPAISLFREASFGHGQFNVVNMTHARWTWHRNSNDISVVGDGVWLTSLFSTPGCF
ncbi:unnamed protein product [Spirodela intermedia]|uniref:Purple acid phosphatase n=1 Tax=Spirodela intermedia TaxID=51605 RepID=A0A7I8IUP4_SPIIN|nr:unnamed protein product [Spirodela intermedia]CAA6660687.1 unnamed protein product [Spirodela intermedia]